MGSSQPEAPAYTGATTRIGGRDVSTNRKVGNNVVTSYNPTAQEQAGYEYAQSQIQPLYQKALASQDFTPYAEAYKQNQLDELNKSYQQGLGSAASQLISSGQMGSSQGLDQIKAFNSPFMSQQAAINANAPLQAQQLQSNQQAYDTANLSNLQNLINQYYNTGNTFMGTAANASNNANSFANAQYGAQMSNYLSPERIWMGINQKGEEAARMAAMAAASDIKTKKNIIKIGEKNGINIYEFEYKIDKYPELPEGKQVGVIAQEVEHIPNAVIQGDKYKLVDYAVILPLIA